MLKKYWQNDRQEHLMHKKLIIAQCGFILLAHTQAGQMRSLKLTPSKSSSLHIVDQDFSKALQNCFLPQKVCTCSIAIGTQFQGG